jgi:hypothetical protein
MFPSELSGAGSRVVSAVDIGSPHDGSSQVRSSYVWDAVSVSCSRANGMIQPTSAAGTLSAPNRV